MNWCNAATSQLVSGIKGDARYQGCGGSICAKAFLPVIKLELDGIEVSIDMIWVFQGFNQGYHSC